MIVENPCGLVNTILQDQDFDCAGIQFRDPIFGHTGACVGFVLCDAVVGCCAWRSDLNNKVWCTDNPPFGDSLKMFGEDNKYIRLKDILFQDDINRT